MICTVCGVVNRRVQHAAVVWLANPLAHLIALIRGFSSRTSGVLVLMRWTVPPQSTGDHSNGDWRTGTRRLPRCVADKRSKLAVGTGSILTSFAAVFFGRDDESDRVINLLHQRRKGNAKGFVLVLGASGCGKSSLVRAGVLPQLKRASNGARAYVVVPPFLAGKGLAGLALSFAQAFKDAGQQP